MLKEGIIIRCSVYKDYDAIINLLTNSGLISFKVRNVFKENNKNNIISSILLYGRFILSDNDEKFLIFKEFNSIVDTRNYINNLNVLSFLNLINEIILKLIEENDLYLIFEDLSYILKNVDKLNLNLTLTYFILKIYKINGIGLNTSNLDKNSISYDFINGGFISIESFDGKMNHKYNEEQLKILYFMNKIKINNINNYSFKTTDISKINNDLIYNLENNFNITLKCYKLISKVL